VEVLIDLDSGIVNYSLCYGRNNMDKEKTYKFASIVFKSTSLLRGLEKLRKHYKAESQPEPLVIPYILTCAAYLESKLNDSLFIFAITRYGEEVADALMSLRLPKKLNVLVPVMTEGRYRIKKEHIVYQRLISLIRVRNSITHAKSELEETTATPDVSFPPFGIAPTPSQSKFNPLDITLGASKTFTPLQYHDALEKLEKWFFQRCPDKLSKVAMVVDRSNEPQWEEHTFTMVKELE
jgi:hypothetical protein